MSSEDERTVDLPVAVDVAFDATCRALSDLGWALTDADRAAGIVDARGVALFVQPVTGVASTVIVRPSVPTDARVLDQVEAAIRHQAAVPVDALPPPPGTPTPGKPAGWYTDPAGRHEHRWWDGHRWTHDVSTAGVHTTDPLTP